MRGRSHGLRHDTLRAPPCAAVRKSVQGGHVSSEQEPPQTSALDKATLSPCGSRVSSPRGLSLQDGYMNDHYVDADGQRFAGHHYLVDVWGDGAYLKSEAAIQALLRDAAQAAGATVLHIHTHQFGDGEGISGIAILAESHISAHTWPERGFAAFDMFLCGDTVPEEGLEQIQRHTGAARINVSRMKRGLLDAPSA